MKVLWCWFHVVLAGDVPGPPFQICYDALSACLGVEGLFLTVAPGETFSAFQEISLDLLSSANITTLAESAPDDSPAAGRNTTATAAPVVVPAPIGTPADAAVADYDYSIEADSPSAATMGPVQPSAAESGSVDARGASSGVQAQPSSAAFSSGPVRTMLACMLSFVSAVL